MRPYCSVVVSWLISVWLRSRFHLFYVFYFIRAHAHRLEITIVSEETDGPTETGRPMSVGMSE